MDEEKQFHPITPPLEIIEDEVFRSCLTPPPLPNEFEFNIPLGFSEDVGQLEIDLSKLGHLLVCGENELRKEILKVIVTSLIYRYTPEQLNIVLFDPFVDALNIPHLMIKPSDDPVKSIHQLKWLTGKEIDRRYRERTKEAATLNDPINQVVPPPTPRILCLIPSVREMLMVDTPAAEYQICKIAQLGRWAGIHLIVGAEPSVNQLHKLGPNLPHRATTSVPSEVDSRIALGCPGAESLSPEQLIYSKHDEPESNTVLQRFSVKDEELLAISEFYNKKNIFPEFDPALQEWMKTFPEDTNTPKPEPDDELLEEAIQLRKRYSRLSVSLLQRRLRLGYNRAARILEKLEEMEE